MKKIGIQWFSSYAAIGIVREGFEDVYPVIVRVSFATKGTPVSIATPYCVATIEEAELLSRCLNLALETARSLPQTYEEKPEEAVTLDSQEFQEHPTTVANRASWDRFMRMKRT